MAERAHPDDPGFNKQYRLYWRKGIIPWLKRNRYRDALYARYKWISRYCKDSDVLDAPCGMGWGTSLITGSRSLHGMDISKDAIKEAKQEYGDYADFSLGSLALLPYRNNMFDVVACLEGIEHVPEEIAHKFLNEAWRVLKPGGMLFLTSPYCITGKHSGNPYHLREYRPQEIKELLSPWFLILEEFEKRIDAIQITHLRLLRREIPLNKQPETVPHTLKGSPSDWVLSMRNPANPYQFKFAPSVDSYTLLSSCFAALSLQLTGDLQKQPTTERDGWAEYIQSHQQLNTGMFVDPMLKRKDLRSQSHSLTYMTWQSTFFAVAALDALDTKPMHPLSFVQDIQNKHSADSWMQKQQWNNPWLASNMVMFLLSLSISRTQDDLDPAGVSYAHAMLDWLDEHQDPETGYWNPRGTASLRNAMAGAFHFYFFYYYLGRPIKYVNRIIDSTLSLQAEDGLFGKKLGGGACIDLDAIDILVKLSLLTDYRSSEIYEALQKAFVALWVNQNSDGSFCEAKRPLPAKKWQRKCAERLKLDILLDRPWGESITSQAGWRKMQYNIQEGDLWSTWFRTLSLALISLRYPKKFLLKDDWVFVKKPALGWHNENAVKALNNTAV